MMNLLGLLSKPVAAFMTREVGQSTRLSSSFSLTSRRSIASGTSMVHMSHLNRLERRRSLRFFASANDDEMENGDSGKRKQQSSKKLKVKEITPEKLDKLAAAFDELARKEGFESSSAHHADEETFEDDFDDDFDGFDDDFDVDVDFDEEEDTLFLDEDSGDTSKWNLDDVLDSSNFDLNDFDEEKVQIRERNENSSSDHGRMMDENDDDDDFLDFGGDDDDMEARITAAKKDISMGRISVPEELDAYASRVDLSELGFRQERNPFGDDETPRKSAYTLVSHAMTCSACGSDFQSRNEQRPGFLPPEKFEIQTKLAKIEEMQQLKKKAESAEWSPEDEVEYLIQTASGGTSALDEAAEIDVEAMAGEMGIDLVELARKKVICKRCHGLQNFGKVDNSLRPGWTDEPTMSQEQFRELLRPISEKPAVIVALVDLFDFGGSVLRELDGIAGENPVILAANKMDLLPSKMGKQRAENWVRRELEYMGVKSLANIGGAVRLISCKTGAGVKEMLEKARGLADEIDGDVYVVGAANAGKSTLINHVLGRNEENIVGKIRAGNRNAFKGALTTSPLPGTTLKFIKIDIGDGRSMYDTPGLLVPGTFTQLLTPEELKVVCPKK